MQSAAFRSTSTAPQALGLPFGDAHGRRLGLAGAGVTTSGILCGRLGPPSPPPRTVDGQRAEDGGQREKRQGLSRPAERSDTGGRVGPHVDGDDDPSGEIGESCERRKTSAGSEEERQEEEHGKCQRDDAA